jgi:hypothetical protein
VKGLWVAAAVLGALLIGGIPALALTLAADESSSSSASGEAWQPGDGAPPWANGHGATQDKAGKDKAEKKADDADGTEPAKPEKPQRAHGPKAERGNGHGAQMREWAHCVAAAEKPADSAEPGDDASDGTSQSAGPEDADDGFHPEQACGKRPATPGQLKQAG